MDRSRFRQRTILAIGLLMLVFGGVVQLIATNTTNNAGQMPSSFPDDRDYVAGQRGSRWIALRRAKRPGDPEAQVIFVYTDGHAQTGISDEPFKTVQLPPSLQQSLEQLRRTWCANTPTFGSIRDDMLYYSFAFDCGWEGTQIIIPADRLPPALHQLLALFDMLPGN